MKVQSNTEPSPEEFSARSHRETASQRNNPSTDHGPIITCECARWGSPCPHYLWDEAREAAGAADAAIMAR